MTKGVIRQLICIGVLLSLLCTNTVIYGATLTKVADNRSIGCQRPIGNGLFDEVANKTYILWNGPEMDIYVRAYDHQTNSWNNPIKIKDLNQYGRWDYHNYPTMILAPNGKIQIYYATHTSKIHMIEAPYAHSLEGDWDYKVISSDRNCYPMPVVANDEIYVFYSKDDDGSYPYRTFRYVKSLDNGVSWGEPQTIIDSGKNHPLKFDEVYAKQVRFQESGDRVLMSWSMNGGISHNKQARDLHYAYLNTQDSKMYGINGMDLGTQVDYSDFDQTRVFESEPGDSSLGYWESHNISGGVISWIGDNPVIAFGYYDVTGDSSKKSYLYCWDGVAWKENLITDQGYVVKDIDKIDTWWDDFRIIAGQDMSTDDFKVYTTNNGNYECNFRVTDEFTLPLDNGAIRASNITFIENTTSTSPVEVIWSERGPTDHYYYTKGIWSVYTCSLND